MWHVSFTCMTWLSRRCDKIRLYVQHDSFVSATWLIRICDTTYSYARHDSFIGKTWLIHRCDVTRSYMQRDSYTRATWLFRMRESCGRVTWHFIYVHSYMCIHMCAFMNVHSYVRHDSFMLACLALACSYMCTSHVCDMTHSCVWDDSFLLWGGFGQQDR